MKKDDEKLLRQLSLLSFLHGQTRPVSAREIQLSVEGYAFMDEDTFTRRFFSDRADLRSLGLVVESTGEAEAGGTQAYYLPEENYYLPAVEFSEEEVSALSIVLTLLDGRFAYARPLRLALTALTRGRPNPVRCSPESLPLALAPDDEARTQGRQLARLEDAVARGKTVSFDYPNREAGGSQERTLDPYGLFLVGGHWYVVGRDHLRDAIRTFRVGRIVGSVAFHSERPRDFVVPPTFDPEQYRARPAWLLGKKVGTARIRVDDELAWWVDRLAPFVRVVAQDAGRVDFETEFADADALLSWVVTLGSRAELTRPEELRHRLHDDLLMICTAHAGPPGSGSRPATGLDGRGPTRERHRRSAAAANGVEAVAPERLARALTLLHYLLRDPALESVSWEQLKTDLGLDRSEIEADLAFINLVNHGGGTYPLYASPDDDGLKVNAEPAGETFARPARLSPVMARALLLALDVLRAVEGIDALRPLEMVREKVAGLLPRGPSDHVVVDDLLPPDEVVVETLNRALRDGLVARLEYYNPAREELSLREVEPYLLFRCGESWYLEAWCRSAQGERTFRIDRVRAVRLTGEGFTQRPDIDLTARQVGAAFATDSRACWSVVRFPAEEARTLLERGLEAEPLENGGLRARIPYLDERWLVSEILRHLGRAVLDEPSELRAQISELACTLAGRYGDGRSRETGERRGA